MDDFSENYTIGTFLMLNMTFADLKEILEGSPFFISKTEEVIFISYILITFICCGIMSGILFYLILYDKTFHTPYYIILLFSVGHTLILVTAISLTVLYISFSGSNPYRGSPWNCSIYRIFTFTPMLANWHNLCLLSAERMFYFYKPFWYSRAITNTKIIILEVLIILTATIFSILSGIKVDSYFSVSAFLCLVAISTSSLTIQMVCYYFLSVILIISAIISLFVLVNKHRRAIADQVQSVGFSSDSGRINKPNLSSGSGREVPASVNVINEDCNRGEASCNSFNQMNQTSQIKSAAKLIATISGIFWLTLFPSIIGIAVIRSKTNNINIELGVSVKYRIRRRFLIFYPFLSSVISPSLYLYLNKPLKDKLMNTIRKYLYKDTR